MTGGQERLLSWASMARVEPGEFQAEHKLLGWEVVLTATALTSPRNC